MDYGFDICLVQLSQPLLETDWVGFASLPEFQVGDRGAIGEAWRIGCVKNVSNRVKKKQKKHWFLL